MLSQFFCMTSPRLVCGPGMGNHTKHQVAKMGGHHTQARSVDYILS